MAALACCAAAACATCAACAACAACAVCASPATLPAASRGSGGPSHSPGSGRAASPPRCPPLWSGVLLCGATGGGTWAPCARSASPSQSMYAGVAEPVEGAPHPCLAGGEPPTPHPTAAAAWEATSHGSLPAKGCEGGLDERGVAGTRERAAASAAPTSAAARQGGEARAASGGSSHTVLALAPPRSCRPALTAPPRSCQPPPGAARGDAEASFAPRTSGCGSIDAVERVMAPPATMLSIAPRDCGVRSASR